ncbi:hypothetical protein BS47DRAFT_793801 [Hydnum rufescens UP504]|uniref:Uncharacterized protein n=1 Tax=Hydnum rufescens UP504 TaxID=1448309 RepID=A0A9P6DUH2_9AGAM|nr:hypothetical protein BS47DRAFT_793801 [Hydnum rufescens UP504]
MDYGWINTPRGYARGGRSIKSFQPAYIPSPLNRAHMESESPQSSPEQTTPSREATTVSPENKSAPREARRVPDEPSLTVTPRDSQELVQLPPIDPDRIKKLVEAIASAINWARTLTENEDNYKGEHDALLAILYILTVRLNEGCSNRHEVVSHRADWDWPLVSVTLRGYIQKLKDFQVSLAIDSDPNTIAARLNAQIIAHNNSRAETEAIRQAQRQKEREDKMARRAARAEIRQMHNQFTAMRRAQMEGVELTELLGDVPRDEDSQSPPLIPDGSMGSRSLDSKAHYASNLQQVLAPLSSPGSRPSMSSLGSIIPPNRSSPRATEQSTPSRHPTSGTQSPHSARAPALLVPPGSLRESSSGRQDVPPSSHTRPADPHLLMVDLHPR